MPKHTNAHWANFRVDLDKSPVCTQSAVAASRICQECQNTPGLHPITPATRALACHHHTVSSALWDKIALQKRYNNYNGSFYRGCCQDINCFHIDNNVVHTKVVRIKVDLWLKTSNFSSRLFTSHGAMHLITTPSRLDSTKVPLTFCDRASGFGNDSDV